jgi:hypothetical protein
MKGGGGGKQAAGAGEAAALASVRSGRETCRAAAAGRSRFERWQAARRLTCQRLECVICAQTLRLSPGLESGPSRNSLGCRGNCTRAASSTSCSYSCGRRGGAGAVGIVLGHVGGERGRVQRRCCGACTHLVGLLRWGPGDRGRRLEGLGGGQLRQLGQAVLLPWRGAPGLGGLWARGQPLPPGRLLRPAALQLAEDQRTHGGAATAGPRAIGSSVHLGGRRWGARRSGHRGAAVADLCLALRRA